MDQIFPWLDLDLKTFSSKVKVIFGEAEDDVAGAGRKKLGSTAVAFWQAKSAK